MASVRLLPRAEPMLGYGIAPKRHPRAPARGGDGTTPERLHEGATAPPRSPPAQHIFHPRLGVNPQL